MIRAGFRWLVTLIGLCLLGAIEAAAQHGHPLVGSWSGNLLTPGGEEQRLLLVLEYEDDTISGAIYFGTRRVPLRSATLDPSSWSVRLEAAEAGSDGEAINYLIEGRIGNLGSTTERTIAGSLTMNGERGDFEVVMN